MIRTDQGKVGPKYFLYQLLSPTIQADNHVRPLSKRAASPHLKIGTLRRFPFVLPDVAVQDRVIAELEGVQTKVDAVKTLQMQTAAEMDAMLAAILGEAFKGES